MFALDTMKLASRNTFVGPIPVVADARVLGRWSSTDRRYTQAPPPGIKIRGPGWSAAVL